MDTVPADRVGSSATARRGADSMLTGTGAVSRVQQSKLQLLCQKSLVVHCGHNRRHPPTAIDFVGDHANRVVRQVAEFRHRNRPWILLTRSRCRAYEEGQQWRCLLASWQQRKVGIGRGFI